MPESNILIGEVHALPGQKFAEFWPDRLAAAGCVVNACARASDDKSFFEIVSATLVEEGLEVVECQRVATIETYCTERRIGPEIAAIVESVKKGAQVEFSTFHFFDKHDS